MSSMTFSEAAKGSTRVTVKKSPSWLKLSTSVKSHDTSVTVRLFSSSTMVDVGAVTVKSMKVSPCRVRLVKSKSPTWIS